MTHGHFFPFLTISPTSGGGLFFFSVFARRGQVRRAPLAPAGFFAGFDFLFLSSLPSYHFHLSSPPVCFLSRRRDLFLSFLLLPLRPFLPPYPPRALSRGGTITPVQLRRPFSLPLPVPPPPPSSVPPSFSPSCLLPLFPTSPP